MRNHSPLTILHLAAPAEAGGLETVVLDLSAGLLGRGHRVVLGAILDAPGAADATPRRAEALGVEVARIVVPHRAYLREYRAVAALIRELRADVVHTHGYRADLLGGRAARQAGVPWVTTAHGFTGGGTKARFYEFLQVRAFRRATRVVAVSRSVRDHLVRSGVPGGRTEHIPNAWAPKPLLDRAEARRRLGIAGGDVVVGWVGRLTPEKGADVFLEAMSRLRDLPWCASIIGDGSERPALERKAEALGIGDRVRWHGLLPDAVGLYSAFDAWVLSSRTEGTPIALFEAMAAGLPVVATEVGGVPDVLSPNEGLLVPSEHPVALAAAVRAVLVEPGPAKERANAAHRRLRSAFTLTSWVEAHQALYRAVVGPR